MKERHDKNLNECKNLIYEFGKQFNNEDLYQNPHSTKSICCIPFWIVKQSTPTTDLASEAGMSKFDPVGNDATFQAIFSANHSVDMEPTFYPQEDDKTLINIALGPDNCNKNKPHKMPYHRLTECQ